jgi:hypothetical protein
MTTDLSTIDRPQMLVALSPHDVGPAQVQLSSWCRGKIVALGSELREHRQNLRHARASKWKTTGWSSMVAKTKRRMIYYAKIKSAVDAGYLVVPNFDIDVFAVKTTRPTPPRIDDHTGAEPDLAPAGRGRYVDDVVFSYASSRTVTNRDGTTRTVNYDVPTGYDFEPDIPLRGVKPIILDATQRALALRIFDQIGVVKQRKQDPIIVGQIIDPDHNGKYWKKTVCFFIAWWLDPSTL